MPHITANIQNVNSGPKKIAIRMFPECFFTASVSRQPRITLFRTRVLRLLSISTVFSFRYFMGRRFCGVV